MGAVVVQVGHDGLVHSTVPLHVSGLSESVSVHVLVVLMVHGVLSGSPLSVGIGHGRVGGQNPAQVPVEKVGVVSQGLRVLGVVVQHDGSGVTETSTDTTEDEEDDPTVSQPASSVEALDGELTNEPETDGTSELGTGGVVGPVEIRSVHGSSNFLHVSSGEPGAEDSEVLLGLRRPVGGIFLKGVLRDTEANKLIVLNVLGDLGVQLSTVPVIIGILKSQTIALSK